MSIPDSRQQHDDPGRDDTRGVHLQLGGRGASHDRGHHDQVPAGAELVPLDDERSKGLEALPCKAPVSLDGSANSPVASDGNKPVIVDRCAL
jgi:hypothetical protein